MRWRWRRSIGFGPIRTTLSTRGIGWSVGIPGFRYGISPTGRRYISVGIPGTGIYGIQYLSRDPAVPSVPVQASHPISQNQVTTPYVTPQASLPAVIPSPAGQKWWQQKNLP
jgi:hypothetical protein